MIGIRSLTTGRLRPMEFMIDSTLKEFPLPAPMSVTGPESYLASAGSASASCRCRVSMPRPISRAAR